MRILNALVVVVISVAVMGRTADAGETRAISGMELIVDGKRFYLKGLRCPDPETPEGRQAKALLNTMLRSDDVDCHLSRLLGEPWFGTCVIGGRDPAEMLRKAGLCS